MNNDKINDKIIETMTQWVHGEITSSQAERQLSKLYTKCSFCGREVANPVNIEDEPYCPYCAQSIF